MKQSSFLMRLLYRMSPVRSSRNLPTPQPLNPSSIEDDLPKRRPPLTINDAKGDFVCPFLMPQCEEDPDAPSTSYYPKDYR